VTRQELEERLTGLGYTPAKVEAALELIYPVLGRPSRPGRRRRRPAVDVFRVLAVLESPAIARAFLVFRALESLNRDE
jgi:hypothetical protein